MKKPNTPEMSGKPIAEKAHGGETLLEGSASVFSVLAIGLFVLTFVFQNFVIPSSSMASTLLVGDHVVVEREMLAPPAKWASFMPYREVHRGDVIVFYKPTEDPSGEHTFLVKRVVGVPGDRIHLRNGILYLNGIAQNEAYAAKTTPANYDPYLDDFPSVDPSRKPGVTAEWSVLLPTYIQGDDLVIPPGKYFAMGDNRSISLDSRYWGFVPRENIVGRPLFVYWSIVTPESGEEEIPLSQRAESTAHEAFHFFDKTRWSRTFHPIQ
jgi:signal peptidase I